MTPSEAPARIDMRDLVSDLEQAVRFDSASYERGNGRQLREVDLAREAIVAEYTALRQRYEEAIEALRAAPELDAPLLTRDEHGPRGFDPTAPEVWLRRYDAWRAGLVSTVLAHYREATDARTD